MFKFTKFCLIVNQRTIYLGISWRLLSCKKAAWPSLFVYDKSGHRLGGYGHCSAPGASLFSPLFDTVCQPR